MRNEQSRPASVGLGDPDSLFADKPFVDQVVPGRGGSRVAGFLCGATGGRGQHDEHEQRPPENHSRAIEGSTSLHFRSLSSEQIRRVTTKTSGGTTRRPARKIQICHV